LAPAGGKWNEYRVAEGPTAVDGIRVGIGGWTFAPVARQLLSEGPGAATRTRIRKPPRQHHRSQRNLVRRAEAATYAKWRDETPDGFVFSAKAPKRITMSRTLANTGAQVDAFLGDIATLGDKLGPIVWQFEPPRRMDVDDFSEFLALLPAQVDGRTMRHVLDVRLHDFVDAGYLALARQHGMAAVFTDSEEHPSFADVTADFVYARLMRSRSEIAQGYPDDALQRWAQRARQWAGGGEPDDLPRLTTGPTTPSPRRDVYVYFISSAKERNPAAAMALLKLLGAGVR
jgi:uncharacterized protein YecE (DUF72 family)